MIEPPLRICVCASAACGKSAKPGQTTRDTHEWFLRNVATVRAVSDWAVCRAARLCTVMEFSHDSNGDGVAPRSLYQGKSDSLMNRNGPRTAPPTEVEWPFT